MSGLSQPMLGSLAARHPAAEARQRPAVVFALIFGDQFDRAAIDVGAAVHALMHHRLAAKSLAGVTGRAAHTSPVSRSRAVCSSNCSLGFGLSSLGFPFVSLH